MKILQRIKQVLIALDQLLNTIIGLFTKRGGWADETLSAKAYRLSDTSKHWKKAMTVFNGIFFWQKNHCEASYLSEKNRSQLAPEYRQS